MLPKSLESIYQILLSTYPHVAWGSKLLMCLMFILGGPGLQLDSSPKGKKLMQGAEILSIERADNDPP